MIININGELKDSLTVKMPKFVYEKLNKAIDDEVAKSNEMYDPFGFAKINRTYKSNISSFKDKVFYIVSRIHRQLSYKERYNKSVLCTDFSEKQLTSLLGDCTRNRTKIGWQSIKNFLISNKVLFIADNLFIHDSYLNKSQSIAYTIYEFNGLKTKPSVKTSKNGYSYSSNKKFTVDKLELVEYTITNKSLLKSIAIDATVSIDTDTVVGHQWELLNKYSSNELDYKFVTNCISGEMGEKYLFHEDRNKKPKPSECSLLKGLSNPEHNFSDFRVRQSPYSSRIFSPITSARKYARSFINFNDRNNKFTEFDMKSSQIVLAALLYNKLDHSEDSERVLHTVVRNDIYSVIANVIPKMKGNIHLGKYTREEMKKLAFKSIFSKREFTENAFTDGLKKLFPKFHGFLLSQKTKSDKSKLAIKLQRLESAIFVGNYGYNYKTKISKEKYPMPFVNNCDKCVLGELYRLGIDAFSVHDAILVNVSQATKLYDIKEDEVWDRIIAPIIFNIFNKLFGEECFGKSKMNWLFGVHDQSDKQYNEFLKNAGEMKMFTRHDNFNQFSRDLFDNINKKYNTKFNFNNYIEYLEFVKEGDFRKEMYDEPDSDSYWDTHDKNSPKYTKYFELIEDCPF